MRIFFFLFIPLTILMNLCPIGYGEFDSKPLTEDRLQYHMTRTQPFGYPFSSFTMTTESISSNQYSTPRQATIISNQSTFNFGFLLNPLCAGLMALIFWQLLKKQTRPFQPFAKHWLNGVLILSVYALLNFLITFAVQLMRVYSYWIQSRERMNSIPGVLLIFLIILYFPTLLGYLYSKSSLKFNSQPNEQNSAPKFLQKTRSSLNLEQAPATTLTHINQPSSILPKKAQIEAKPPISE